MSERVADYVGCVRAQGAQLGEDRSKRLSAEVGVAATKVGGVTELRDTLEKRYSVSQASEAEIVRTCSSVSGMRTEGSATSTPASDAWRPAPAEKMSFAKTVAHFATIGDVFAKSDCGSDSPRLFPAATRDFGQPTGSRTAYEDGRFVIERPLSDGYMTGADMVTAPEGDFIMSLKVRVVSGDPTGYVALGFDDKAGTLAALEVHHAGGVFVRAREPNKPDVYVGSGTVTYRTGRESGLVAELKQQTLTVWLDGEKALTVPTPVRPMLVWFRGGNKITATLDDIVMARLK